MKLLNTFVFVLVLNISYSQYVPFPSDYAEWYMERTHWDSGESFNYGFDHIVMNGDTVYNNKSYKKVYTGFGNYLYGFLREDSKKIYFKPFDPFTLTHWHDTSEIVLYDFNLEIGDTFKLEQHYVSGNDTIDLYYSSVVLDTSLVQLNNGEWRKRLHLSDYGNGCLNMEWVEGIGNISYHPFFINIFCFEHQSEFHFFIDQNDTLLGHDPITNIIKLTEIEEIEIFPNPTDKVLNIHNQSFKEQNYRLINIYGDMIKSGRLIGTQLKIDILEPGVYILMIEENEIIKYAKFLKN